MGSVRIRPSATLELDKQFRRTIIATFTAARRKHDHPHVLLEPGSPGMFGNSTDHVSSRAS